MKYKILFITKILTHGGAQRVCASVANGLSRFGHNVSILTDLAVGTLYSTDKDIQLIQANYSEGSLKLFKQVNTLCKIEKYDVIINFEGLKTLPIILAARLNNVPIVYSEHNSFERPSSAPMPRYEHFKKFYLARLYDCLTVLTQRDLNILKGKVKQIYLMPNPLFLTSLEEVPIKEKIILAVGRLGAWHVKGFDLLIEAWSKIEEYYPDWTLKIVGGGDKNDKKYLCDLANKYGIKKINIVDYKSNIVEEYRRSEVFVLSSRYEGFGLVLIEALSQRCACIACDYFGRQSEIIENGINGIICNTENVEELQSAISKVLGDDLLRKQLQNNSLYNINKYNEIDIAKKWEVLINKIRK